MLLVTLYGQTVQADLPHTALQSVFLPGLGLTHCLIIEKRFRLTSAGPKPTPAVRDLCFHFPSSSHSPLPSVFT